MIKELGFTLVELMIVLVIIGLLMAYALPSYQRQVIVSKRTEAHNVLLQLASAEETNNTTFNRYTTTIGGSGTDGNSLGITAAAFLTSVDYNYTINNADGYTIIATAIGTTQPGDVFGAICTTLTLNSLGIKTPIACW